MFDTNATAESTAEITTATEAETMTAQVIDTTDIVIAEKADDGTHFPNQVEGELLTSIDESKDATALATVEEECFIPVQSIPASMAALYEKRHTVRFGPDNAKLSKDRPEAERMHAKTFVMWVKPNGAKDVPFRPMMSHPGEPQQWLYDCHISDIRVINIADPEGTYNYNKVEIDVDQLNEAFTITAGISSQSALSMLPALCEMADSDHPLGIKQRFHLRASTSKKTSLDALKSTKAIPVYVALQDPDRPLYRNDFESYKASFFKHEGAQGYLDSVREIIADLRKKDPVKNKTKITIEQANLADWALTEYTALMNKIRAIPQPEVDTIPVAQNVEAQA